MKIKVDLTKKKFTKYLWYKQRKITFLCLILGTIIYYWISFYMILKQPLIIILGYLIYLLIMIVIISLFNLFKINRINSYNKKNNCYKEYLINIDDNELNINNKKYQFSQIKNIKINKIYIVLFFKKDKKMLLFIKNDLSDEQINYLIMLKDKF